MRYMMFINVLAKVYKKNSTEVEWAVLAKKRALLVRIRVFPSKSGHLGGRTRRRNRFTLRTGMRMKESPNAACGELQYSVSPAYLERNGDRPLDLLIG